MEELLRGLNYIKVEALRFYMFYFFFENSAPPVISEIMIIYLIILNINLIFIFL